MNDDEKCDTVGEVIMSSMMKIMGSTVMYESMSSMMIMGSMMVLHSKV